MASPARFERATFRLGGERSILLSYGEMGMCLFCRGAAESVGLTAKYYNNKSEGDCQAPKRYMSGRF